MHYTQVLHLTLKENKVQKNLSTEQSLLLLWKGHEAGVLFLKYTTADFLIKKDCRGRETVCSSAPLSPSPQPLPPLDLPQVRIQ